MKKAKRNALIAAALAAAVTSGAWANSYEFHLARVIDSDTYEGVVVLFPGITITRSIRVDGIDTPEKFRPKCDKEHQLAKDATAAVESMLFGAKRIFITKPFPGKYAGRTVATVLFENAHGARFDLGQTLIDSGLAVAYDGGKKTKDWCG